MRRKEVEALRGRAVCSLCAYAEPSAYVRTRASELRDVCDKALEAEDEFNDPPQLELDL